MKKLTLFLTGLAFFLNISANNQVFSNANSRFAAKKILSANAPEGINIITEQPEGDVITYVRSGEYLVASLYGYNTDYQSGQVKVTFAPDGETVYILDPLAYGEGTGVWVKGELSDDGSSITVSLGQYVAYNEEFGYGLILEWGSTELVDLGEGEYWLMFTPDENVNSVTYALDSTNGIISMQGSVGNASADMPENLLATGLAGVWSDDASIATVEWKTTWTKLGEAIPAVPANPEAIEFFDSGKTEGYTRFDFNIKLEDVDGQPLHSDYVSYSIYTDDDQLFIFDYDTYGAKNNFEADMTEIPYGFSAEDFYLRRVYFYRTNAGDNPLMKQRIGIQVYYTVNGERNSSDIVYLDVNPDNAVNGLQTDKQVITERYYNLSGQEITNPNGVSIKVSTYDDGSVSTVKVLN